MPAKTFRPLFFFLPACLPSAFGVCCNPHSSIYNVRRTWSCPRCSPPAGPAGKRTPHSCTGCCRPVLVLILAACLVALLRTGAVPALLVWLLGCSALILLVCSRNIFIRKDPAAAAFRAACILLRVLLRCAGLIVDIFLRVLIFLWGLAACFKFLFIHIEKPPCIRSAKHLCRMIDLFGFHDFYYTAIYENK